MRKILSIISVLFLCASCKNAQVTESVPKTPYELWQSLNLHNYTIDQKRSCFCIDAGELVRITVRSDTVYSVIKLSNNSVVTNRFYYSVESMFGIINNSKNDSLVIKYNQQYGFPEYLDINPQWHPIDGGALYETSNLRIE